MINRNKRKLLSMKKIEKGLISEDYASIWLTKNNYYIFNRKQEGCPIDIVGIHKDTGRVIKLDVKSVSYRKTWKPGSIIHRKTTDYQKQLGVKLLYVHDNGECSFDNKRKTIK